MTIIFYCLKAATFPRLQRRADKSEFFFEQEGAESDYETLRTSGTVTVVQLRTSGTVTVVQLRTSGTVTVVQIFLRSLPLTS